jgi:hypothetical protein
MAGAGSSSGPGAGRSGDGSAGSGSAGGVSGWGTGSEGSGGRGTGGDPGGCGMDMAHAVPGPTGLQTAAFGSCARG